MSPRDDGTLVLFFIRLLCRIPLRPPDAKVRRLVPLGLQPGLDVHVPPTESRSIPSSLMEAGEADSLPASSRFTGEKDRAKKNVTPPGILVYMACGGAGWHRTTQSTPGPALPISLGFFFFSCLIFLSSPGSGHS